MGAIHFKPGGNTNKLNYHGQSFSTYSRSEEPAYANSDRERCVVATLANLRNHPNVLLRCAQRTMAELDGLTNVASA